MLSQEGVTLSDEEYFASLGMDDVAFVKAAYARNELNVSDEKLHAIIEREYELHRALIEADLPIDSAVVSFIKECAREYPLGIVSMAVKTEIDYVLTLADLSKAFTTYVTADHVRKHKPAPDCYELALKLMNEHRSQLSKRPLNASECVVIEDAPPGIEAGRLAGMKTLGVTNTVSEAALRSARADVVTHSLADWTVDAIRHVFDQAY